MVKILKDTKVYNGYLKVHKVKLEGDDGKKFDREYLDVCDAVCAVIYNSENDKYVFVKQYRVGCDGETLEVVAGSIDEDETSLETVIREIEEETGYEVDTILPIMDSYYYNPGKSNGKVYSYFATVSNKVGEGGGLEEEHEDIEVIELSKKEIKHAGFHDTFSILCLMKLNLI